MFGIDGIDAGTVAWWIYTGAIAAVLIALAIVNDRPRPRN